METAGKTVDDEELRDAMKENGIGRPSTRAAIIETLFKRRYIYRERKNIMASQAGIDLIATINQELLKSAKLTGIWENKLRRIERGDYSAAEFIDELKAQINEIVINVLNDNSARRIIVEGVIDEKEQKQSAKGKKSESSTKIPRKPRVKLTSYEQIQCPVCKTGHIVKGKSAFGCSNYASGCKTIFSFSEFAETLTPDQLSKAIKKKK